MTTNTDLWRWTQGERIWLHRRALDLTQEQLAERWNVCDVTLWRIETDQMERRVVVPLFDIGWPHAGDLCALARRRSGMGLRETAAAAAVSYQTVLNWEDRGDEKMVQFWRDKGYRFPR